MSELQVPIRIKRGVGGAPAQLLRGELAYAEDTQRLYIGEGSSGTNDASGRPIAQSVRELTTPPSILSQLQDVVFSSGPNDGDVLTYDGDTDEWIAQAVAAASVAWADVTGKPSVFTPDTHTHAWGDITSGVPSTFAPSAHNHTIKQELSGFIESPEAKTYVLTPSTHAAMTITQLKAQTSVGTVDIELHDDSTIVTDASLADAGTTLASLASDISVVVAAGSKLTLVVGDPQSSPENLAFTVHYTIASENNS
jgi:hypothetical protein